MRILLIDDIRTLSMVCGDDDPDEFRKLATTFSEGIEALDKEGPWDVLHLDHDLGDGGDGADIMLWLAEHQDKLPKEIYFVTANIDGYKRMAGILKDIKSGKVSTKQYYLEETERIPERFRKLGIDPVTGLCFPFADKEDIMKDETLLKKLKWAKENKVLTNAEKQYIDIGIDLLEDEQALPPKIAFLLRQVSNDK